jgi:pyochelin biosynthesis protein PchC
MLAGKSGSGRWIRGYRRVPGGVSLFCFPHAGGAASYFRGWPAGLAPGIEVLAVQYPGREDRAVEPCLTTVADLADQIQAALGPSLPGTFAFFGHSMGAILAFEVARRIAREQGRGPAHLFVSGRPLRPGIVTTICTGRGIPRSSPNSPRSAAPTRGYCRTARCWS